MLKTFNIILVVLLCLLQYRLWFGDGNLQEVARLHHSVDELRQQAQKLDQRNQALQADVMDLKQGMEAIEERARQDLGMIQQDETFFQIIEPDKK